MKFLYFTDTHATGRGPSSRTDSYVGAVEAKLREIVDVIKKENIEAVFHGGDLFDKPVVSIQLTGMIAEIIQETGVPWYVVPGNHDLFGYNINSLPQTSLGLLSKAGVITILDRAYGEVVFTDNGKTISFEGQEYHMDIDKRDPALDYYVTSQADYKVLIPHSMLLDKEYFPEVPYTRVDEAAKNTDANLILVGHYHDGYPMVDLRNKSGEHIYIYNPGSMMRDEASKGNLVRHPKFIILDYNQGKVNLRPHLFRTAKPGADIFDRSHITKKQEKNRYLQAFEQKLQQVSLSAVDVRTVMNEIAQKSNVPADIVNEANQRLTDAQSLIDDITKVMAGYQEKPHNISIDEIIIKGFQSHEDTRINLSGGLNAIIGPSDSGKSSIIRALKFALYNEPKGSDFIRQGLNGCSVTVRFSDGSQITRNRTRSSAGSYEVVDSQGVSTEFKGFANNIPVDIPNTHQMPILPLTKDIETSLNIGFQLDGPFLIGESPGTRAAIIGQLTGVNLVDTAMKETNKVVLGNNRDIKTMSGQLENVHNEMAAFDDLEELKKTIESVSRRLAQVDTFDKVRNQLIDLHLDYNEATQVLDAYIEEYTKLEPIARLAPNVSQIEDDMAELNNLKAIQEEYDKLEAEETHLSYTLWKLGEITLQEKTVDNILEEFKTRRELFDLYIALHDNQYDICALEVRIDCLLPEVDTSTLSEEARELQELKSLLENITDNRLDIVQLRKDIRKAQIEEEKYHDEHDQILQEHGVCPTCNQEIRRGHTHV